MHTLILIAAAKSQGPWIDGSALWKIIVIGMAAGAGIPAIFAIGLRLLTLPAGKSLVYAATGHDAIKADQVDDKVYQGNVPGLVLSLFCFAVCLAAVGWSIYQIKVSA